MVFNFFARMVTRHALASAEGCSEWIVGYSENGRLGTTAAALSE